MKLLIACDDATDVQVVLADLQRAGLAPTADAVVLSVADLLPSPPAPPDPPPPAATRRAHERAARALQNARRTAEAAAALVHTAFPGWRVTADAQADAPAWAIVKKADDWSPDLIVVGAHDQSALGRFLLGSVSQAVLAHAGCSVRIVRESVAAPGAPQRVLVGVDGSAGADAAIARVAARTWRPGAQVQVVTALDDTLASMLESADDADDERAAAGRLLERAAAPLRTARLDVSTAVVEGAPKWVLVEQAESWTADCVFVGARGLRAAERFLLGSVSAAVAARAPCSVEVVRG
jgi:nucleotide-binding universal stress UspA family protein